VAITGGVRGRVGEPGLGVGGLLGRPEHRLGQRLHHPGLRDGSGQQGQPTAAWMGAALRRPRPAAGLRQARGVPDPVEDRRADGAVVTELGAEQRLGCRDVDQWVRPSQQTGRVLDRLGDARLRGRNPSIEQALPVLPGALLVAASPMKEGRPMHGGRDLGQCALPTAHLGVAHLDGAQQRGALEGLLPKHEPALLRHTLAEVEGLGRQPGEVSGRGRSGRHAPSRSQRNAVVDPPGKAGEGGDQIQRGQGSAGTESPVESRSTPCWIGGAAEVPVRRSGTQGVSQERVPHAVCLQGPLHERRGMMLFGRAALTASTLLPSPRAQSA